MRGEGCLCFCGGSREPLADLPSGKVQLMSAGALAFGPDGILFVGDNVGGTVVAIDTQDTKAASTAKINVDGVDQKIAALVGVTPDQIVISDMKVNPISENVYLSGARGKGPDAMPLIVRVYASGKISTLLLDNAARLRQPVRRAKSRHHCPAEPAHADYHRHGLRERQPDGGRPVKRGMEFPVLPSRSPLRTQPRAPLCRSGTRRTDGMRPRLRCGPSFPTRFLASSTFSRPTPARHS